MNPVFAWLQPQGSTRAVALMRIGLPLIAWARWGRVLGFWREPDLVQALISASFFLSTSAMLVGWKSRFSSLWAGATGLTVYYWLGMVRDQSSLVHHHTYLLCVAMLLLAWTDCGRSLSWDRYRALKRGDAPPEHGDLTGSRLIALQMSAVYFWGTWSKVNGVFLSGDALEFIYAKHYGFSDPVDWFGFSLIALAIAWGTVVLEAVLVVLPYFDRTRIPVLLLAVLFHAGLYVTVPISTFTITMYLLYLSWFPAEQVHGLVDRLLGAEPTPAG